MTRDRTSGLRFRGVLDDMFARHSVASPGAPDLNLAECLLPAGAALPVAPAADRSVWDAGGTADPVAIGDILRRAEVDRAAPWPAPLASAAVRVHEDGDREHWERLAFARQHRLSRAAIVAARTLDQAWLSEVLDGIWMLCEQSSWCWPAHDDAYVESGSVLPLVTSPFLDLGAGEVVAQLAWIDHLLGPQLEASYPGIRGRIRHEARIRVFDPFQERRDWHWLGLDGDVHNWNPWIHGNVLVAALQLLDDDERVRVVALAIEGLDRYVTALPPDGAIDEGYAYWWNGACRALEALDILRYATGGTLDASRVGSLAATVSFPHRMHFGGPWYLNLADGQARPSADQPWHALHRAARATGDMDALAHAAAHRIAGAPAATELEGLGRVLRGITDPDWMGAETSEPPLPREVWFASTEVWLARGHAGSAAGLAVAAKGGHNDEHHNHNDVGSFVVAVDGVPVIVDAGRPTYTLQTFGPQRYDIWSMQSGWHNTPVLRGVEQSHGAAFAARHVTVSHGADGQFTAELAPAYAESGILSWRRTVRLDRTAQRVEILDAWTDGCTTGGSGRTQVRMLIAGDITLGSGCATVVPLDGARPVRITWPAGIPAALVVRELDDPMLADVWGSRLTRLDLDVAACQDVTVTVELDSTDAKDLR